MVFNATFNNISVISWRGVILKKVNIIIYVGKTGIAQMTSSPVVIGGEHKSITT